MLDVKRGFYWHICYMTLATRIARRLEALELSESEACRRADLAHTYIRDIRKGKKRSPRPETLDRLAAVLGTTSEWLRTGKGNQVVDSDLQTIIDVWDDLDGEIRLVITRLATAPPVRQVGADSEKEEKKRA